MILAHNLRSACFELPDRWQNFRSPSVSFLTSIYERPRQPQRYLMQRRSASERPCDRFDRDYGLKMSKRRIGRSLIRIQLTNK